MSPNNPTGAVSTPAEVTAVGRWAADNGLWVVTDEIYEHLVYGDRVFTSMPVVVPELAERCIVLNGVAKTYAMTGWRVGWLIGPPDVVDAATNLQSHVTSNVSNVAQCAALAALEGDLSAVAEMRAAFDRRRHTIHEMLNRCTGVTCAEPEGAFYAFPSVQGLLGRRLAGRLVETSAEVAEVAVEEAQVAVVPGEAFGAPGYLRLSYALGDEAIAEGVTRLGKLFATAEVAPTPSVPAPTDPVARVLITEKLADRAASTRWPMPATTSTSSWTWTRTAWWRRSPGAHALIVRSATQVTADVLEAGTDLVVVGRAGIGLDNVDVEAATRCGVMVVNAPESNVLSAAEHAMALLLAQARNVPQAHAALVAGKWERSKWEGVELHGKTLGIVGLGRIGALVAQRALAFGMRLCAYDPYVSPDRARHMGVELLSLEELVAVSDFVTIHLPKTAETTGLIGADLLAKAKPGHPHRQRGPGRPRRRGGPGRRPALGHGRRRRVRRVRHRALHRLAAVRVPERGGDPASGRVHRRGAGQGGRDHRRAGHPGPGGGLRALRRQCGRHRGVGDGAALPGAGRAARPVLRLSQRGPARAPRGRVPGRPGRHQHLDPHARGAEGHLRGGDRGARLLRERSATGQAERGLEVREASTATAHDYVNLITLRSPSHSIAGTLWGPREEAHIVLVDDHAVEVPPAEHMLVVRNDDRPGMIGMVGTALGEAGVSIDSMNVHPTRNAGTALMVLATSHAVSDETIALLRATDGILDIHRITCV